MKRLATAVLAAITFIAPLGLSTEAAAHRERRGNDHDGWDRDGDGRDQDWRRDRRHRDRGYHRGWDHHRYNGYNYRGRWHYGPPPSAYYNDPYFDPGYRAWRRGDRLPSYYRDHYRPVDWRDYRLRAPPRGYDYVRDDRGDYLLVGIATGVILGVILANN